MNVLFVCRANIGRSQAAMELYRLKGGLAESSGTIVDTPGEILGERPGARAILDVMNTNYRIDMKHNKRVQITQANAEDYDKIIVMAEPGTIPQWLNDDPRTEFWDIDDPKGKDGDETLRIVQDIEHYIDRLKV